MYSTLSANLKFIPGIDPQFLEELDYLIRDVDQKN
jgi:hypothetical protein